jgi:hypothetical protein
VNFFSEASDAKVFNAKLHVTSSVQRQNGREKTGCRGRDHKEHAGVCPIEQRLHASVNFIKRLWWILFSRFLQFSS